MSYEKYIDSIINKDEYWSKEGKEIIYEDIEEVKGILKGKDTNYLNIMLLVVKDLYIDKSYILTSFVSALAILISLFAISISTNSSDTNSYQGSIILKEDTYIEKSFEIKSDENINSLNIERDVIITFLLLVALFAFALAFYHIYKKNKRNNNKRKCIEISIQEILDDRYTIIRTQRLLQDYKIKKFITFVTRSEDKIDY